MDHTVQNQSLDSQADETENLRQTVFTMQEQMEAMQRQIQNIMQSEAEEKLRMREELLEVKNSNNKLQQHVYDELKENRKDMKVVESKISEIALEVDALRRECTTLANETKETLDLETRVTDLIVWRKTKADKNENIHQSVITNVNSIRKALNDVEEEMKILKAWQKEIQKPDATVQDEDYEKLMKDLETKLGDMENKFQLSQDKTDQDRLVWDKQMKDLKTKTEVHEQLIQTMQEQKALTKMNMFRSRLEHIGELGIGVMTTMNKCVDVYYDDEGWFDINRCCLIAQRNCRMVVSGQMCQEGEGELKLFLGSEAFVGSAYIGNTRHHDDVCQGLRLFYFQKGWKTWVAVKRVSGEAKVAWCRFTALVVG